VNPWEKSNTMWRSSTCMRVRRERWKRLIQIVIVFAMCEMDMVILLTKCACHFHEHHRANLT
jgi:hypothetical protein